ncbi:GspE/PulE family protein [Rheinheimera maricola]|uniref:Flp pilus assembly complex ATPase component TadA n=1 Tax=Rheinheimera maricola TaxID=2793282 RepID=A0ABS7X3Z7_9GAMM|nr:type II/IV secretion system protein [Rheinheimera maricola]MBZ9610282.1 Flp pilus assembly complex ATPase component TadA [Rheinheimera maricola]
MSNVDSQMSDVSPTGGIASYLLSCNIISDEQLQRALEYRRQLGGRVEHILVNLGVMQQEELASVYSGYLDLPLYVHDATSVSLPAGFFSQLDLEQAIRQKALPFKQDDDVIFLAVTDPFYLPLYDFWGRYFAEVKVCVCRQADFDALRVFLQAEQSQDVYGEGQGLNELERLRELAFGAPTVNLVNNLIVRGIKLRASDMHLEPLAGRYRVRYRVDGMLHAGDSIPMDLQLGVVSRIKILSGMDIAERRKPQDGKIETSVAGKALDIRVSSLPLGEGESVVMRFLVKDAVRFDLTAVGYEQDLIDHISKDLTRTTGVILMTGPTGSGKTTSLYSFLSRLNQPHVKIITLEDPIEYQLDGINQVQVNADIGFDFSRGLRSIVRQDPDIIMVGEIRDQETARIAMQSSLTGHLVFSTVHTNDAPTTFTRLIDLGVEEFLLNASVISVMAQRLVRQLCPHCKAADPQQERLLQLPELNQLVPLLSQPVNICQATGCEKCGGSGYFGRLAILEYLPNDEEMQSFAKDQHFMAKVSGYRQKHQLRTLKQDGLLKVLKGTTTLDEVMRVAG